MADTYQFLVSTYGDAYRRVPNIGVLGRGTGTNDMYFLQVDPDTGALLVDAQVAFDQDTNYGPVGNDTLRTASQIGNENGPADFNGGPISAQTLRVVLADEQADDLGDIVTYTNIIATETSEIAQDVLLMRFDVADIKTASEAINTKTPALGQALKAASVPVTLASDQGDLDIRDLSSATDSVSAVQSGAWNITNVTGTVSLPTGAATETTLAALNTKVANGAGTASGAVRVTIASDSPSQAGRSKVELIRKDYAAGSVTTAAYVELVASTSGAIRALDIFDSSGQTMVLAVGAASSEVDTYYVAPGGNGFVEIAIPSGSRLSVKAVSATADIGELLITALS